METAEAKDPDEPPSDELLRALAVAMQSDNPDAMMDLVVSTEDFKAMCPDVAWAREAKPVDEKALAQMRRLMHLCVPPGELLSTEFEGTLISKCDDKVKRWLTQSFEVTTTGGKASLDIEVLSEDASGRRGWYVDGGRPRRPSCYAFTDSVGRVAPREIHQLPASAGRAKLGMSLRALEKAWGKSVAPGKRRCRVGTSKQVDWRESAGSGDYATRWDPERGLCVYARFVPYEDEVESIFFEMDRDEAVVSDLTAKWGPPDFDGKFAPGGEPVAEGARPPKYAWRRLEWRPAGNKIRVTLEERDVRGRDFYRLEFR